MVGAIVVAAIKPTGLGSDLSHAAIWATGGSLGFDRGSIALSSRRRIGVDADRMTLLHQVLHEVFRSPLAEVDARESAKGKVNQSPVEKMIGRQSGDGPMIGDNDRNVLDAVQPEQIDRGHVQSGNLSANRGVAMRAMIPSPCQCPNHSARRQRVAARGYRSSTARCSRT